MRVTTGYGQQQATGHRPQVLFTTSQHDPVVGSRMISHDHESDCRLRATDHRFYKRRRSMIRWSVACGL
jgi:hypothetical protein